MCNTLSLALFFFSEDPVFCQLHLPGHDEVRQGERRRHVLLPARLPGELAQPAAVHR